MAGKIRPIVFKVIPKEYTFDKNNAVTTELYGGWMCWNSPIAPQAYNGNGKTCIVTVTGGAWVEPQALNFRYNKGTTRDDDAPIAFTWTINSRIDVGTYTFTMANNTKLNEGYGLYLAADYGAGKSISTYIVNNVSFKIID